MPPGSSISAACTMISRCSFEKYSGPFSCQESTTAGFFRNIPSPEQGASTIILWKNSGNLSASTCGGSFVTKLLEIPNSSRLRSNALALAVLISFATRRPSPCKAAPSSVAFPPGAAHRSRTRSPGCTLSLDAGVIALGSCK